LFFLIELLGRKFVSIQQGSCENIPAGYEAVSLIEALNGPCPTRSVPAAPPLDVAETPDQEVAVQAVEALNRFGNLFFLFLPFF
jgi:hypothetical protein